MVGGALSAVGTELLWELSSEDSELAEALDEHLVDPTGESLRRLNEHFGRVFNQSRWLPR